ncbi:MAG: hypothetical protein QOE25_992, partial [Actinomycetota bacterium]|nr:hypothetical protein [Actinomycetota bacterium]
MATDARTSAAASDAALARLAQLIEPGSLLEATPECLVVTAADGKILFANHRMEDLTGFAPAALLGASVSTLLPQGLGDADQGARFEAPCHRSNGIDFPVEVHLGAIEGPERLLVVTFRDASDLQQGREARYEAEVKYRTLVEQIPAVVYLDPVSENEDSIYVSPQITSLIGISQEEWLADPYSWRHHVHPDDIDRAWGEYQEAYNAHAVLNHEYRMLTEDGELKWVLEQAYPIDDEDGNPWLIQGVIFDITQRKQAEEQLTFLAYHDKLTGLPNRALFEEMLEISLARARRHDLGVGVLYLDLDNFKLVNDSLGHPAGDALLQELARRLESCTRDTDLVARQGGDEFLMLLSDLERGSGVIPGTDAAMLVAESVASRVHEALREPFVLEGTEFYASGSLGISLFPEDAADAPSLLKNADAAMYQSKRYEPGGYVVYNGAEDDPLQKLSLTSRLRRAVEEQNWVLHYQPIVDLGNGRIDSVEALIRWLDPNGGIVPPGEFIPLAEEMGLIEAIGDWVIDEMARQRGAWAAEGLELNVAFNLSPRQLWSAHLADKVLAKLSSAGTDPRHVTVEITESTAMADP